MRAPRWLSTLAVTALIAGSAATGLAAAPAASAATTSEPYLVTLVSRVCGSYADIMANRARNNIQESLRDLGKDTVYSAGQPVSPALEQPNNPSCAPLYDWKFQLGTGITGKTPATDYLSTVTGAYSPPQQVKRSVPELDANGQDTGRTIAAAVTYQLTPDQAKLAQQSSKLWVQGGTKADPLLHAQFGDDYGFGALRCAVDNLNGDNVEWLGYPSGSRHVFCYYYAVTPPPSAGTIVVKKALATGSNGPASFRFVGNISYTENHDFTLTPQSDTSPSSASFVRAAGDAWDFTEQPTAGYSLTDVTCVQSTGSGSTWSTVGSKTTVRVGDGATVTCTYTNAEDAPASGALSLDKVTYGGTGSFPFLITRPDTTTVAATATTASEGVPALVASAPSSQTGSWSVRETLPAVTTLGSWAASSVQCNGADVSFTTAAGPTGTTYVTATRTVTAGETVSCEFANEFDPGGELQITKRTHGGTGHFDFPVVRADQLDTSGTPTDLFTAYGVDVTTAGHTTTAHAQPGYTDLVNLPVDDGASSTYFIAELSPAETTAATWFTSGIRCSDIATGATVTTRASLAHSIVEVSLTTAHPRVRCSFDNTLTPVGRLTLSKTITGAEAGWQGPVVLDAACTDGTVGSLTTAAGLTGTATGSAIVVRRPATCTVSETSNGQTKEASLFATTVAVDSGSAVTATKASVHVASGSHHTVAFTDEYKGLSPTGAAGTAVYALLGLALLGLGALLVRVAGRPTAG
jgi:hypothetical protein